jgi:hypothetical protein
MNRPGVRWAVLVVALLLAPTGCGGGTDQPAQPPVSSAGSDGPSRTATGHPSSPVTTTTREPSASTAASAFPCDPGGGFPRARKGCPDAHPDTGWLTRDREGHAWLEPFRTYGNDPRGRAYARSHGLGFPFANDYHDASTGPRRLLAVPATTVCTGIILVGYGPPGDHVVPCAQMLRVAGRLRVPVALWRDGSRLVQLSELYRP